MPLTNPSRAAAVAGNRERSDAVRESDMDLSTFE